MYTCTSTYIARCTQICFYLYVLHMGQTSTGAFNYVTSRASNLFPDLSQNSCKLPIQICQRPPAPDTPRAICLFLIPLLPLLPHPHPHRDLNRGLPHPFFARSGAKSWQIHLQITLLIIMVLTMSFRLSIRLPLVRLPAQLIAGSKLKCDEPRQGRGGNAI
jgi:hypothetical protein